MWRFRDTRNICYGLNIGEKDLAELAFARLSTTLKDKMERQDLNDINQVMQQAMVHENWARELKVHSQFKEMSAKDKLGEAAPIVKRRHRYASQNVLSHQMTNHSHARFFSLAQAEGREMM
jgi:hypothetical protein